MDDVGRVEFFQPGTQRTRSRERADDAVLTVMTLPCDLAENRSGAAVGSCRFFEHRVHRPGADQALAAARGGDTFVVPKLDRLAWSAPNDPAIGDDLAARGIKLSLGGQVYDPADPIGKMFFNILATFAEFEVDLLAADAHPRGHDRRPRRASCAVTAETVR